MDDNTLFLDSVKRLEAEMARLQKVEGVPSKAEICKYYRELKPVLDSILPFLEKIPVWGKQVADGIRLLMKLLDGFCP